MTPPIQLRSDLNAEDDDGANWALLANAGDPSEIQVGAVLVARDASLLVRRADHCRRP